MTCGTLSQTASPYQSTINPTTTVATGNAARMTLPNAPRRTGAGTTAASVVIAVPRVQRLTYVMGDFEEARALANVEPSIGWQIALDDLEDAARARAHHNDAIGQEHGFRYRVRNKNHGLSSARPQTQQLV